MTSPARRTSEPRPPASTGAPDTVHDLTHDLTPTARIRNAALERFARQGVSSTSIRDVAKAAGVSPGLVQHHFKNKDALRDAVNDYVARIGTEALRDMGDPGSGDLVQQAGDRLTAWMRDHHLSLLYLARSIADGDAATTDVFGTLVDALDGHLRRMADDGLLRPHLDRRWAALHVIVMNLATALLQPAIDSRLDAPLLDATELERWNRATTDLFRAGLFLPGLLPGPETSQPA